MKCKLYFLILIISTCILWMGCANEGNPQGGAKDNTPPKLLTRTVKDSTLHFKGGKISFEFDEKIDPNNIVIETFPLMKSKPKISTSKKELVINLPDSLLEPNTTYKISLGNSIKDIYEGNAYNNLNFTFSTGDVLDTLFITGQVLNANTGDADTSAWVTLYTSITSDSDVIHKLPLYATKTDGGGFFTFSNLPNKEFYMYAIGDVNKNYKYDYPIETIAYLPTTIIPIGNSKIILHTFLEKLDSVKPAKVKDRLRELNTSRFYTNIDTSDIKKRTFDITQPITFNFGNKITNWDKSKIRLFTADSLLDETGIINFDSIENKIKINTDIAQDALYQLVLLDGFAKDTGIIKGNVFKFKTKKADDYGTLKINYQLNFLDNNCILQLLQNNKIIAHQKITDSIVTFQLLNPGNYVLNVLNDKNNNGIWDSGKYLGGKLQPEIVEKYNGDVLIKANWINKIDWKLPVTRKKN